MSGIVEVLGGVELGVVDDDEIVKERKKETSWSYVYMPVKVKVQGQR
jgi:hypothetical protein